MGKEFYGVLNARDVLVMDNLSDERKFMVKFYFDNAAELKRSLGLNENETIPVDLPWGVLARHIWQLEDEQAFEQCFGSGVCEREELQRDKDNDNMEEGPPWGEEYDSEFIYRNKGL